MARKEKTLRQLQKEARRRERDEFLLAATSRAERDREEAELEAELNPPAPSPDNPTENTAPADNSTAPSPPPPNKNTLVNSAALAPPPPPVNMTIMLSNAADTANEEPENVPRSLRCKDATKIRYNKSIKTAELVNSTGHKCPLVWSDFHQGPDDKGAQSRLVRDIGACIKSVVPMNASTWAELKATDKNVLYSYLLNYYDLTQGDKLMWDYIDMKARDRYSDWKHKCHNGYKEDKNGMPKEFLHRPHEWKKLIDNEFENEDKKVICERKRLNRTSNPKPMNHHAGSRPISCNAEEYLKKGHPAPFCAAAADAYINSKRGSEKAANLKRKADEIEKEHRERDPNNVQPLPLEDQMDVVTSYYGSKKGTEVRGFGKTIRRAPMTRGGSRISVGEQVDELRRTYEERAKENEQKLKEAQETAARAEDRVNTVVKQMEKMEEMMRAFMAGSSAGSI